MRSNDEVAHILYKQLIAYPSDRRFLGVEPGELLRLAVRALETCPRCHGPVGAAQNVCITCKNLSSWRGLGETK